MRPNMPQKHPQAPSPLTTVRKNYRYESFLELQGGGFEGAERPVEGPVEGSAEGPVKGPAEKPVEETVEETAERLVEG